MEGSSLVSDSGLLKGIDDEGFQNWVTCVLAQNETKKALCEVVEIKWKHYISEMPEEERNQIETFVQCLKNDEIHNLKTEHKLSCTHEVCATLSQRLLSLCDIKQEQNPGKTTRVPSSDACFQYYWDIAKLYLITEDDGSRAGLKGLDISYLSRMMSNCQLFAFNSCLQSYENICQDRDELFHSTENHISVTRMTIMLENMVNLLSQFDGSKLSICKDIMSDIQQLKEKHIQDEYHSFEYKLLVRKCLEDKVAALKLDLSLDDKQSMKELHVLQETENLLVKVNESITEEDSAEITELQAENDRLKETLKDIENDRDERISEVNKLKEKIKDLETERDVLQSSNQMEQQCNQFKKLVERDVGIKDLQFIASIVETKEEFLLSLELLPLALKETAVGEHVFENKLQDEKGFLDPFEITNAQDKLVDCLRGTYKKVVSRQPDTAQKIRHFVSLAREHQTMMVDCFRDCQPFQEMNLIIQITKVAINLKKSRILTLLPRHWIKLRGKYQHQIKVLADRYFDLKAEIKRVDCELCYESSWCYDCGKEDVCLREGRYGLNACVGTICTIMKWSIDALSLFHYMFYTDEIELNLEIIDVEDIDDEDLDDDCLQRISIIENGLAKFYKFCQIYVGKASQTVQERYEI